MTTLLCACCRWWGYAWHVYESHTRTLRAVRWLTGSIGQQPNGLSVENIGWEWTGVTAREETRRHDLTTVGNGKFLSWQFALFAPSQCCIRIITRTKPNLPPRHKAIKQSSIQLRKFSFSAGPFLLHGFAPCSVPFSHSYPNSFILFIQGHFWNFTPFIYFLPTKYKIPSWIWFHK